ncbi:unnamed protein product [Angiostrongylus costaricensis]|uniref:U6 snRNA-associated Sm-like protein LSm8 n=2 Tax=Metastrongylidae TaxID=55271 RepID=A0A0R3P9R9_ANGCS|nr:unnamed protein product [Angiostrongylus costaricensis]
MGHWNVLGVSQLPFRKIFVGGIAYDVLNEDLTTHFQQFGEVAQAQVKFDRITGRSRGFAFVEFTTGEGCKAALATREQTIKNKQVEVKPAKSRENKKVFVGGLPSDYNEGELRTHFEQFGKVEDIEWPFDKQTKMRRNFAFIVFEEEEAADKASAQAKQTFGSRECDVKKAVPQGKRFAAMGGRGNGMRPYGGRGGVNGAAWYGAWGQMGMPYGAGAAGWGDWYGAANSFYGQQNGSAAYGNAYGAGGELDAVECCDQMTSTLDTFMNRVISVVTGDGRNIIGMMKGFDQLVNVVLEDSHERVYCETQGVEQIPLGLYIIRGDNIAVIGELDEELDKRIDLENVKAAPLAAIWIQG